MLHLGTAVALLCFFWRDWLAIIRAVLRSIAARELSDDPNERLGWLIVAGSVPAGVLGLFLKQPLTQLFGKPWLAAVFLALNGLVLLAGERLRLASRAPVAAGVAQPPMRVTLGRLSLPAAFGI